MDNQEISGILSCTAGFGNCMIVVGPSINQELICEDGVVLAGEEDVVLGQKNLVLDISSFSPEAGKEIFEVTIQTGKKIRIEARNNVMRLPAGSSLNVAFNLMAFGIDSVGIFAPIGTGKTGKSLTLAIQEKGCELMLSRRHGTALTLNVREKGRGTSTLFCEKPPFEVHDDTRRFLEAAAPKIIVATGVKQMDVGLVKILFEKPGSIKVLNPSADLLRHKEDFLRIARGTDLMQVNEVEAGLLLGRKFTVSDIREISQLVGSIITVVTMGEKGAILLEQGKEPIEQEGFPAVPQDSSGPGDAHLAAVVYYYYLRGNKKPVPIGKCLAMASWIASCKVASIGPWSGIPSKEARQAKLAEFWPDYQSK